MATFKVGQRVRKVRYRDPGDYRRDASVRHPIGAEATVKTLGFGELHVLFDDGELSWVLPYMIVPLADPRADAFIESIRKMKPYDEPKVAPRVHVLSGSGS